MKAMKLSDKVALGVGVLIALVILLAGTAIWEMAKAGLGADIVSQEDVPMAIASVGSRRALTQAWHEILLYGSTEKDDWRASAEGHLKAAHGYLKTARDLTDSRPRIAGLKPHVDKASEQAKVLETALTKIIGLHKEIDAARARQDACATQFMNSCSILMGYQTLLLDDLTKGVVAETNLAEKATEIRERFQKLSLINELLNAGNLLRVTNWKSQALHEQSVSPTLMALFDAIAGKCEELAPLVHQQSNVDQLALVRKAAREYRQSLVDQTATMSALAVAYADITSVAELILVATDETAKECLARVTETSAQSSANLARATHVTLVGLAVSLLLGGFIALRLYREITTPILKGVAFADKLMKGDFSQRLDVVQNDEIGMLAKALNAVTENLQSQIAEMREAANVLASSASEISASVTQVTSGAQETATAVTQTTATIEEVKQSAHLTSQKSTDVAANAQRGLQTAYAGKKATETAVDGMTRINEQMASIAETTMKLGEQGQAIGEITSTVDDIAEQSNLLAVNAAVEAAKAGEYGKGFAVVAQEIKTLAEQSKQATKQVRGILHDIQKATGAAVMATEQGSKSVEQGAKESLSANESIQTLSACFTETVQAAGQIAASMQELLTGMDQVALAMGCIRDASQQNVVSMRQLESSAQTLKDIGVKFSRLVEHYKV